VTESAEKHQQITLNYQAGKDAFERGRYRESIQYLARASALAASNSSLGGEIQIWLVTAYEAAGQSQEAIALCRQLNRHPDAETRKQSRQLLYILEAPKLNLRPEWLNQIPDLSAVSDRDPRDLRGGTATTKCPANPSTSAEPVDLGSVNTQDNQFLWAALVALALTLGGLIWFS